MVETVPMQTKGAELDYKDGLFSNPRFVGQGRGEGNGTPFFFQNNELFQIVNVRSVLNSLFPPLLFTKALGWP